MGTRLIICDVAPEFFFAAVSYISSHYIKKLMALSLKRPRVLLSCTSTLIILFTTLMIVIGKTIHEMVNQVFYLKHFYLITDVTPIFVPN